MLKTIDYNDEFYCGFRKIYTNIEDILMMTLGDGGGHGAASCPLHRLLSTE